MTAISLLALACSSPSPKSSTNTAEGYQLVWADEFDYQGLPDSAKWSFDTEGNSWGWGNNEAQYYTAAKLENARVEDGILYLTARKEDYQDKAYTSARLRTAGKGDWLYGRFEVRAKLPEGRGLWPAIWFLPTDWAYGDWPASGEIDLMENVGYMPDTILSTVHTKAFNHIKGTQKGDSICVKTYASAFHVYRLDWDAESISMYVDDQHVFSFNKTGNSSEEWPFDKRFHLLLNLAVGGNWGGLKGIDDRIFPQSLAIDYVRVYQKL